MRRLYESTPAMLHSIDMHGRLLAVSDQWLRKLGYARDEVLGRPSVDFLTAESARHATEDVLPRFFRTGSVENVAYQMVCKDGALIDVELSAVLERDRKGRPLRTLAALQDVTERKAVERQLAGSEALLRTVAEHVPATIAYVDRDERFRFVNRRFCEVNGKPASAFIGRTVREVRGEQCYPEYAAILRPLLTGGNPGPAPPNVTRKGEHWVSITTATHHDASGAVAGALIFAFDVTREHLAAEALRRSEQRLRLVADNIAGIASHLDRTLCYRFANRAYADWFGIEPEALIGRHISAVYPPEVVAAIEPFLRRALAGETILTERAVQTRDALRFCHVMLAPSRDANGDFDGVFAIHTDISERHKFELELRASQERLARTGALAKVGGWEYDVASRTVTWSDQTCLLHDRPVGHCPSTEEALDYYVASTRPLIEQAVQDCMANGTPYELELEMISARGRTFWAQSTGRFEALAGPAGRLVGALQDVTERRQIRRALAESHEVMRIALDSIAEAVITTDRQGHVAWLNPAAEQMTGWLKDEARGLPIGLVFRCVGDDTRQPASNPVSRCLALEKAIGLAGDTVLISRKGLEIGIEDSAAPVRDPDGQVVGAVLVFHDVSEQRRLSREMVHRATHDMLTGLVNRSEFEARVVRALTHSKTDHSVHGVMYIDLDQFKLVNDSCGHAIGDQLLKQVSALLRQHVRDRDTVARLGGDEFGILLEHCDSTHAQRIGKQICDQMEEFRFMHDGRRFRVGASIGLVAMDEHWQNLSLVLQAADTACYAAKEGGRNRVHAWFDTDSLMQARKGEMGWTSRLEQAMDDDQFVLYAQTIAPLQTPQSTALHCEILLRLQDVDGSMIAPGAFMPAAERYHLTPRIDRWVIRHAFDMLEARPDELDGVDMVAINLSGQSIGDRSFHRDLQARIRSAAFDVRKLCFEITETVAITNLADASEFIDEIRALGPRIALDDFGSGASSFGYLKHLPVDLLKIDGQFVSRMLENPLDHAAVRCFADVARIVGVKTIGEFVERADVRAELQALGIDMCQGYLIHRPEPFATLLARAQAQARALSPRS